MSYTIRPLHVDDYSCVRALWEDTEGMNLEESDSEEAIAIYLNRNRGLCFVACDGETVIGTLLCGHDGRRGIIRHLAVRKSYRRTGIAKALIERSLSALAESGIKKCNIFVLDTNVEGRRFWEHLGWHILKDNYWTMQRETEGKEPANQAVQPTGNNGGQVP